MPGRTGVASASPAPTALSPDSKADTNGRDLRVSIRRHLNGSLYRSIDLRPSSVPRKRTTTHFEIEVATWTNGLSANLPDGRIHSTIERLETGWLYEVQVGILHVTPWNIVRRRRSHDNLATLAKGRTCDGKAARGNCTSSGEAEYMGNGHFHLPSYWRY
jgi:hypothetical protein